MNSLSNALKISGIAIFIIITQYFSEKADSYPLVRRICMININKEIINAGIDDPKALALETCKCFTEKVRSGQSINNAKEICKSKLQQKRR